MKAEKLIIGFTDSVNECDCCGKKELKGTYCVIIDGEELYYGSTCVKNNLSIPSDAALKAEVRQSIEAQKTLARNKFSALGGKDLENRLPLIDFCTKEWDELNEKVTGIKKAICLEFKVAGF